MGRKRKTINLSVYLGQSLIGTYSKKPTGATSFQYSFDWLESDKKLPISLTIPLTDRIYTGDAIAHYFDGLLPDSSEIRTIIAAREGANSSDPFDLLNAIGRDCVGALRFIPQGEDPGDSRKMTYERVTKEGISRSLANLARSPLGMSDDDVLRISLAGMQEKTAFLWAEGQWNIPSGATATSHIFKPPLTAGYGGADLSDSTWNEWFCLKLYGLFGLPVAESSIEQYDDTPIIIIKRFDRLWHNNILYRRPQEDLCQSLGIPPHNKYQKDSGPDALSILQLLGHSASPAEDQKQFLSALIIAWMLASTDGHGKNYSILLTPYGYVLTPIYDVMSVAPYREYSLHKIKMAMSVGDKHYYHYKQIQIRHFYQTAKNAGISAGVVTNIMNHLKTMALLVAESAITMANKAGMPEKTYASIIKLMLSNAKKLPA